LKYAQMIKLGNWSMELVNRDVMKWLKMISIV